MKQPLKRNMKPKFSTMITRMFKSPGYRESFYLGNSEQWPGKVEHFTFNNTSDIKKGVSYFKTIPWTGLSIKSQPKMKSGKLVILGSVIFALIVFSYIIYKQRASLMDSVWLLYNPPVIPINPGINGGTMASTGMENFPWHGRSLEPLFNDMRPFTLQTDYDYLQEYIQSGGVNITQMSLLHVGGEAWMREKFYLKYPPLTDLLLLPNETFCQVHVLNPKPEYAIGDHVSIRIDLYNGYNRRMFRGGDTVEAWVTETRKKAAMACDVTDLHNGSYHTSIPVTWQGTQQVHVSIRYTREMIRALVYTRWTMKSLRYVAAGFLRRNVSETTLCLPFPRIPGYPKLCNFTQRNYGNPWFCGYPRKKGLHCSDWKIMRDMEFPKPLPLTFVERRAMEIPTTAPTPRTLKQKVVYTVTSGQLPTPPPCDKTNFTHTWTDRAPQGFYMDNTWVPTACSFPAISLAAWATCLSNTTVILAGDSNLLMWMHRISTRVHCQITKMRSSNHWHTPLLCRRADLNFSMIWQLHGYPEHPTSTHWADITHFRTACRRIDGIPATGKYVVIVHLFIHFSIHHSTVLHNRLQCIRRAIIDLLNRNPTVKVFIRGPFTATKGWNPIFGGEMVTPFFLAMLRHEFRALYDRVILLNMWDMTLAGDNKDYHPDSWIDNQMTTIVLNHMCNN